MHILIGNQSQMIEFKTRSGILKAIQGDNSSVTLDFPINPPSPYKASHLKDIIDIISPDLDIQDIQYSSTTKKLLLRLADKYHRYVLLGN